MAIADNVRNYILSRDMAQRVILPLARFAQVDFIAYAFSIGDTIELDEPVSYSTACSSKDKEQ